MPPVTIESVVIDDDDDDDDSTYKFELPILKVLPGGGMVKDITQANVITPDGKEEPIWIWTVWDTCSAPSISLFYYGNFDQISPEIYPIEHKEVPDTIYFNYLLRSFIIENIVQHHDLTPPTTTTSYWTKYRLED